MNAIKPIRKLLGVTQKELADGLVMTQGNVSNYERGQSVPPDVAGRLVTFALTKGVSLSLDQVYGFKPLPAAPHADPDASMAVRVGG